MIIKRKTQIILALFVTSVFLFQGCATLSRGTSEGRFPERKNGSTLIITKKDGHEIKGELITVKPNSLLLLDRYYGRDVSIEIRDIRTIRIIKKSKARLGYIIGGAVGYGVGVLVALSPSAGEDYSIFWNGLLLGSLLAMPASLLGGTIGAIAGTDKTIYLEGMTDSEIQVAMNKLSKRARIRDYK